MTLSNERHDGSYTGQLAHLERLRDSYDKRGAVRN